MIRRRRAPIFSAVLTAAAWVVLVGPLYYLLREGWTPDAARLLAAGDVVAPLLWRSLKVGVGGALLAGVLGVALGVVLARAPLRRRGLWLALCVILPATPVHVLITVAIYLAGRNGVLRPLLQALCGDPPPTIYSAGGVVLIHGLRYAPLVALIVAARLLRCSRVYEDLALLDAAPAKVLRAVTLRLAAPAGVAATLLVALLCLADYELPALLETPVYPVYVVSQFQLYRRLDRIVAAAVPLALLSSLLIAALIATAHRAAAESDGADGARGVVLRGRQPLPWLLLALPALLIAGVLLWRAGGPAAYAEVLIAARFNLLYSLWMLPAMAAAATAGALTLGLVWRWGGRRYGAALAAACSAAWAAGAPVCGVAAAEAWTALRVYIDYWAHLPLLATTAAWLLPVAAAVVLPALARLDPQLEDAARADGANGLQVLWHIVVPALATELGAALLLCAALALGEVTLAVLLCPPGYATLAVRLATLLHYAPEADTAAFCLLQYTLALGAAALFWRLHLARRLDYTRSHAA